MKRIVSIIAMCMLAMLVAMPASAGNRTKKTGKSTARTAATQSNLTAEQRKVISFLTALYKGNTGRIMDDDWVEEHTTASCQEKLIEDYDYDGDGYAVWMIGGWGAGEDMATKFKGVEPAFGDYYDVTIVPKPGQYAKGKRVVRLLVVIEGGVVKIDDYEWVQDFEYD